MNKMASIMNDSQISTIFSNDIKQLLDDMKFKDIVTIDVEDKVGFASEMIIATVRSERHIISSSKKIIEHIKKNYDFTCSVEGLDQADWVLIDLGSYIIHLFKKETRENYNLEDLWRCRGKIID